MDIISMDMRQNDALIKRDVFLVLVLVLVLVVNECDGDDDVREVVCG